MRQPNFADHLSRGCRRDTQQLAYVPSLFVLATSISVAHVLYATLCYRSFPSVVLKKLADHAVELPMNYKWNEHTFAEQPIDNAHLRIE